MRHILELFFIISWIYVFSMAVSAFYHAHMGSREPKGFCDFIKMTFLPYVIFSKKDKFK